MVSIFYHVNDFVIKYWNCFQKKEDDSISILFIEKFRNLLDDYIVNSFVKYLCFFLFISFFVLESSFFVFDLIDLNFFFNMYITENGVFFTNSIFGSYMFDSFNFLYNFNFLRVFYNFIFFNLDLVYTFLFVFFYVLNFSKSWFICFFFIVMLISYWDYRLFIKKYNIAIETPIFFILLWTLLGSLLSFFDLLNFFYFCYLTIVICFSLFLYFNPIKIVEENHILLGIIFFTFYITLFINIVPVLILFFFSLFSGNHFFNSHLYRKELYDDFFSDNATALDLLYEFLWLLFISVLIAKAIVLFGLDDLLSIVAVIALMVSGVYSLK